MAAGRAGPLLLSWVPVAAASSSSLLCAASSSSPGRGAGAAARAQPDSCVFSLSRQESGKMAGAETEMSGAGIQQQQPVSPQQPSGGAAPGTVGPGDESSDSEGEHEGPQKLIRKVSTSGQIRSKTSIKEGLLLKQTSSFQRWKKRYFKLRGRTLYYAKDSKSLIFDEVDLSDASVAESSTKNVNNSFTVWCHYEN
uniref:PH domain-containing protein n=1 Tax=Sphenodon punctatus TaxID=8508 RepID=A0A8D0GT22_SPHPU